MGQYLDIGLASTAYGSDGSVKKIVSIMVRLPSWVHNMSTTKNASWRALVLSSCGRLCGCNSFMVKHLLDCSVCQIRLASAELCTFQ